MLQRIQTIFLILVLACAGMLFTPPMDFIALGQEVDVTGFAADSALVDKEYNIFDHILLIIITVSIAVVALLAVFQFRNRQLQAKLSRGTMALSFVLLVLAGILFYLEYDAIAPGSEIEVEFGIVPPILAIIFAALATRNIRKDEKLVRSADRLR